MSSIPATLPAEAVNAKLISMISSGAVFIGVLLSGFVIAEPAPYELYMAGLIAVWALFGLRISRPVGLLLSLLVLFNLGGVVAMAVMPDLEGAPLYLAVSLFLALTAVFYAAVTEADPDIFGLIFAAWVTAALATAALGIAGYFGVLPGAEMFTRYGRAAGAFEDPNVFGPFLTLPGIWLLHRLLIGPVARMPIYALPLGVIAAGIFFSFSRGAWGLFLGSSALLAACLFLQSASGAFRLRILVMALLAAALLTVGLAVILQIPEVSSMFTERARLAQDYDSDRLGRFARYGIGFLLALEKPFGIGPLVFGKIYGEDTHNIWLKALLDYGWLGFAAFAVLIAWTLAAGFRILFRDRPWQPYFLCAYIVLVGHLLLGSIIDIDHWRHFYLLLGLTWGGIALEHRHVLRMRAFPARPLRTASEQGVGAAPRRHRLRRRPAEKRFSLPHTVP